MIKKISYVFLLLLCLSACKRGTVEVNYPVLKASLKETKVSMNDLFSKVEVVPLETNDSCLLVRPYKVLQWDDYYGVFDFNIPSLFVYDSEGKFIRRIGRRGQGPGEFTYIYSVLRDDDTGVFYMLSPFSELFSYSADGTFRERVKLPQKFNYWSFEDYGDYWVTWSHPVNDEDPGISIISKETLECVHHLWYGNPEVCVLLKALYKYGDDVYFNTPMNRNIYKITKDSMKVAYAWDFGADNYSVEQWGISETKWGGPAEIKLVEQYRSDCTIPYALGIQAQTDKFYYSGINIGFNKTLRKLHLFYRKSDGKNVYFETTSEGLHFKPMYWGEDYVISISDEGDMLDLDIYKAFLPPSEYAKIANRKEDDNPFLLKCYYK